MTVLVFSLAAATALQVSDGTWYTLAPGSLTIVMDPSLTDTSGNAVTPGDQFLQWTDGGGQSYAAPYRSVINLKFPGPISSGGGGGGGGP